jgi:hypothetical protein
VRTLVRISACIFGFMIATVLLATGFNFMAMLIAEGIEYSLLVLIGLLFIIGGIVLSFFSGYYLRMND